MWQFLASMLGSGRFAAGSVEFSDYFRWLDGLRGEERGRLELPTARPQIRELREAVLGAEAAAVRLVRRD